jgi:hypothetical protein
MTTTIERLQEIEYEREQVYNDPKFHRWMEELHVSRSYVNPIGILNARDMMVQYDYNRYKFNIKA